ncbi:MAG: HxsD-like protein [Elusimicrobiota bacterium]
MTLKFNARLYSKRAVQDAVRVYKRFARLKVRETRSAIYVDIDKPRRGVEASLPGEFGNYVLVATRDLLP